MKLRKWQADCISLALNQYSNGNSHFLVLATPGAGKTLMASELADQLLKNDLIDLIICFSPSSIVSQDFSQSLELRINERFDGLLGAKGHSLTYQSLQYLDSNFWQLFHRYRVFVIFDEIHHCAGSTIENANAWGEQIIAVDNNNISVVDDDETKTFTSFKCLLSQSVIPYQEIIENEKVIKYVISSAQKKLNSIRAKNSDAAGLIVASSVEHAKLISTLMKACFDEGAVVVTYRENEPTNIIQRFRNAQTKWIISVGMISEGTNIPRLQVCCHLTNIKTEMHFRQILGRILRMTGSTNQEAVMYMPAEPKLLEYAYRVKQDIPFEADVVKFEKMRSRIEDDDTSDTVLFNKQIKVSSREKLKLSGFDTVVAHQALEEDSDIIDEHFLTRSYEKVVNIFGRFQQEAIALGLSELR